MEFQLLDIAIMDETECVVVHLFGVNLSGQKVHLQVYGFRPFFYVRKEKGSLRRADIDKIAHQIQKASQVPDAIGFCISSMKKLYGWEPADNTGRKTARHQIAKIHFPMLGLRRNSSYKFRHDFVVDEDWISPQTQFFDLTNLLPGGWVNVKNYSDSDTRLFTSLYRVRGRSKTVCVDIVDLTPSPRDTTAPITILSFDIECVGPKHGTFPQANRDAIIQIGNVVGNTSSEERHGYIFCLNATNDVDCSKLDCDKVFTYSFKTEDDLLEAWHHWAVFDIDPEIMTGWNTKMFDWPYIQERMEKLHLLRNKMLNVSRFETLPRAWASRTKDEKLRRYYTVQFSGRVDMDLMNQIKSVFNLPSYKLNEVADKFLNFGKKNPMNLKLDLPAEEIFDHFYGDSSARCVVATYCVQDCILPLKLISKLAIITQLTEMAKVCSTSLTEILNRGEQIKILNLLVIFCHRKNTFVNRIDIEKLEKYKGAIVIEPIPGYYDIPVATLDFASLYPTIMIGNKLCYSTLVLNPAWWDLPHASYLYVENDNQPEPDVFIQHKKGILPAILAQILKARSNVKKEMAETKDATVKTVLNARQLALKVTANTVYGFTGTTAEIGKLPCVHIARSVTSIGRGMISISKAYAEKFYLKDRLYAVGGNGPTGQDPGTNTNDFTPPPGTTQEMVSSFPETEVIYGDTGEKRFISLFKQLTLI